jgi:hypothetical protein
MLPAARCNTLPSRETIRPYVVTEDDTIEYRTREGTRWQWHSTHVARAGRACDDNHRRAAHQLRPRDLRRSGCPLRREWLVTDNLGGYASGTLAGINTRR